MGLAMKGTRRITIGGCAYRWLVSPDDGYLIVVVELADEPGQRLEAFFHYHDSLVLADQGVPQIAGQRRTIRPGVVRTVIEMAIGHGWRPYQKGLPAFRVHDADELVPVVPEHLGDRARGDDNDR